MSHDITAIGRIENNLDCVELEATYVEAVVVVPEPPLGALGSAECRGCWACSAQRCSYGGLPGHGRRGGRPQSGTP